MFFMTETIEVAPDMTELEARQVVSDIKRGINTVRARIYDLDRRRGWKALGYRSFAACCMEEFPQLHAKTITKELAAARVEARLMQLEPNGSKIKPDQLPTAHLRPLVSVKNDDQTLVAAYTKAQEIAQQENQGKLTEAIVTRAVQETKPQPAASSSVASVEPKWSESELERKAIVEAGGAVVANMHADGDQSLLAWARQTGRFLRIDRQSDWGNPFEMPADGDRDTVCDSYEIFFARKFSLHSRIAELEGKVLGCWCYPQRCHGDYLVSKLEGPDA